MKNLLKQYSFLIALCFVLTYAAFLLFQDRVELIRVSGYTMGTSYDVQFVSKANNSIKEQVELEISELLKELDREIFSTYSSTSELSRLNRFPDKAPFVVSDHLLNVLMLSEDIFKLSSGAFDITVGPLVNIWGFGPGSRDAHSEIPSPERIEQAMTNVGQEYLSVNKNNSEVIKAKDISLDLSGIAKGYAVDEVASLLSSLRIDNFFVEIGGEIKVKGVKPGDLSWVPAIEAPVAGDSQVYKVLSSLGETISIAGSGDYRNYYEVNGVRYSHEIDPRTGRPITHNLAAAFVLEESAAKADALATAFMVMGPSESKRVIQESDIKALLILRADGDEFRSFTSNGFDRYLER